MMTTLPLSSRPRRSVVASLVVAALAALPAPATGARGIALRMELREGWSIRSSAEVTADGPAISTPGFDASGWLPATVPSTVVAALVAAGTCADPYVGMNLRGIPGTDYPIGENFSWFDTPAGSPFRSPWWYRTEFDLPASAPDRRLWLRFGGVNYAFDAWLNGVPIADSAGTAGSWRTHEFDVTGALRPGRNALAVRVHAPQPHDLAITFVDWNPMPPDKAMGIFRAVTLASSGPVALRHPQVVSELVPGSSSAMSYDRARLSVRVFARNGTEAPVRGTLGGRIGAVAFSQEVTLGPQEDREIEFTPDRFPQLVVLRPELWWPAQYGSPHLQTLRLEFLVEGVESDRTSCRFGIRQVGSRLDSLGHRVFEVNGRPILVRGAGWSSDMLLRSPPERQVALLRYAKDIGLNAIRLEGKLEDDAFLDAADSLGLLVMAGWCCCDHWEQWDRWDEHDLPVALASLRDQVLRLRGRASVMAWLNGSDGPPPDSVERAYVRTLGELKFPDPVLSSASDRSTSLTGPSGVKMLGPYEWVPPLYWYVDSARGGAHGFATEVCPGPAPPPLESLRRFLSSPHLWPIDSVWDYHCGGGVFADLKVFNAAMDARYGPARGVEDYARTAQIAAYESHRAMFESFGARKYRATGVIQWMFNNAWPSMIWHLVDAYLRPGGSYYGAKKACEPLHVQYSYDDRSVVVVNSTLRDHRALRVTARVFDTNSVERLRRTAIVALGPDAAVTVFRLPPVAGISATHFVDLTLADGDGRTISRNSYWLSTQPDVLAWDQTQWYVTPVSRYADLTGLRRLPPARLRASVRLEGSSASVTLQNASDVLAFGVHLALLDGPQGDEVLPVLWQDNYLALAPGERREITAEFDSARRGLRELVLTVEGWNVAPMTVR